MDERICLFGHTHVPAVYGANPRTGALAEYSGPAGDEAWTLPPENALLINVGSVGQPRDGDPRASYGLLDLETRQLWMIRVEYDIAGAQRSIRDHHLPAWLANRLERGQ